MITGGRITSDRTVIAPKLETVLKQGLERARTGTLKGAWFDTLRRVAITQASV